MPVLSRFYGIIIRMYFQQAEHNPPHIHTLYGEDVAAIDIQTGEILEGICLLRRWQWCGNGRQSINMIFCRYGRRRSLNPFLPLNKELILCSIK